MSAIALLMGLLVLSYLGSLIVGTGKTRGLASGLEFIGLGFAVGPHALSLVERPMIVEFAPIVQVALGWLAFVVGLDFGRVEGRRVSKKATVLGLVCAVITGLAVAIAIWRLLDQIHIPGIDSDGELLLIAGGAAVGCETARNAVEWVKARWGAKGKVTRLLVDIGAADDLAPLVLAGAIFALEPTQTPALGVVPPYAWFAASLLLGGLLGFVVAMLLRGAEGDAVWGALVGTLLLVVGVAARFGLCTIFVTFMMGIALAAASPSRRALRKMVSPTERAVLYPMLLLAGAHLDPKPLLENRMLAATIALMLLARIVGKIVSGFVVRAASPESRPAGPWLGIVMLSQGPVSICCGLVFALRFPGLVGDTLLLIAVLSTALGELISTFALKSLLTEAGEIAPAGGALAGGGTATPPRPFQPVGKAPSVPPPPVPLPSVSRLDVSEALGPNPGPDSHADERDDEQ